MIFITKISLILTGQEETDRAEDPVATEQEAKAGVEQRYRVRLGFGVVNAGPGRRLHQTHLPATDDNIVY